MADPNSLPLKLDIPGDTPPSIPPIAAAFVVRFDHRQGYALTWHRSLDDVPVEGVVEFKSLPSGLHHVEQDVIYFIHDDYVGVSAFINKKDAQAERSARMIAVGVLVPLEHGRMGRSWLHVPMLKELARFVISMPSPPDQTITGGSTLIENAQDTAPLEAYWAKHQAPPDHRPLQTPADSTELFVSQRLNGYQTSRSMSTGSAFLPSHRALTPHHPALTLLDSLQIFGPLIFPLYRAALLRKRILIVTNAPVERTCDLVYNLSIVSSVSRTLLSFLPEDAPNLRLRPLFTVGVTDIDQLEQDAVVRRGTDPEARGGWIACTTDDVLSTKPDLYDVLVLMPRQSPKPSAPEYPRMVDSTPDLARTFPRRGIRCSQRDYHRYLRLRRGLRRFPPSRTTPIEPQPVDADDDGASFSSDSTSHSETKAVVEPSSWSRVAYTSLVWWASAGDRRAGLSEWDESEMERDLSLLHDEDVGDEDDDQTREIALVAYFHRMTGIIFQTIGDAMARADDVDEDDAGSGYRDDPSAQDDTSTGQPEPDPPLGRVEDEAERLWSPEAPAREVEITQDDIITMGLDSWNAADKQFLEDLVEYWWGRKAQVRSTSIECCGMKIL